MKLKSLELQGFKSFPDKTKLDFGDGITAVVGPNGSGKSNISDAVRWVLGEQSTKSLRGAKMEDVIFAGASGRRALGFAEVSLTLDNSDRSLNMDNDDVRITRRYYRSGESEYMINKATVRLRDIHELFMDTGLGRDGYSIISQGKIGDIVASKSSDRREIFEEAAGISKYRYRKTDAERKLKTADENMLRLKDILAELELQVGPLKIQSEKAKKFINLSAQKRELEIGIWLRTLENSNDVLRDQEKRVMIVSQQHEQVSSELESIEQQIEQGRVRAQQLTALIDQLRRDQSVFEEESVKTRGQVDVLKNDARHNSQSVLRLERDIAEAKANGENTENAIKFKKQQIEELQQLLEQKQQQLGELEKDLAQIESQTSGQLDLKDDLDKELLSLSEDISDSRMKRATALSSFEEISSQAAIILQSIKDRRERLREIKEEQSFMTEELEESRKRIAEKSKELRNYTELLSEQDRALSQITKTGSGLKLDADDKRRRIAMLTQMDKDMEGFARSVKAVIKGSRSGSLKGIHGTVSMLLKTDSRYAVAIETALGGALQNIVTDNENDAKNAINMLKSNDGGRATFLPLNVIRGNLLNAADLHSCAGFVGIASDLIDYDSRYDNIFRYLLGQSVIVNNMDDAIAMSRKYSYRFKIVTLDGQVINARGSMTGGSNSRNTGIISRGAQIEQLRSELERINAQIERNEKEQHDKIQERRQAEIRLNELNEDISTENEDRIRIESELRSISNQLEGMAVDEKTLKQQLEQSDSRCEALKAQAQQLGQHISETENRIEELRIKIGGLTEIRERAAAKSREIDAEISRIRLSELTVNKDIEAVNYSLEQLESQKAGFFERVDNLLLEKQKYISDNEALQLQIAELTEKADKLHTDSAACIEKIEQSNSERNDAEKDYGELRVREREKTAEKEKVARELARLDERRMSLQKDYDEIIKKLWDQYELTRAEALNEVEPVENTVASQRKLSGINSEIKSLGSVNLEAIDKYIEVSERYEFLSGQLEDVEKAAGGLNKLIGELTVKMRDIFKERFRLINENFGRIFTELFGGGKASLSLSDPSDMLNSGIDINVQPPGKIINNLDALSGGEKSFTAICLYFAILKVNPSPFCILDEIEAALDEVNVDRFAEYVRNLTDKTQFICITHRHGTMKQADMLYGVTMQQNGVSKLLSLNVSEVLSKMA